MRRPTLLRRFPSLRATGRSDPVLPADTRARYPALAEDVDVLEQVVGPEFAKSDRAALVEQNRYRRQQVVIALGAVLLSGLGGLQAVIPDQRWPGLLLVVLGLTLTAIGRAVGELGTFERFLDERVKAERLRAMHFRYLSRTGRYAAPDRAVVLERAVLAVKKGEEPL
jgi:hypothetical protein